MGRGNGEQYVRKGCEQGGRSMYLVPQWTSKRKQVGHRVSAAGMHLSSLASRDMHQQQVHTGDARRADDPGGCPWL